MCTISCRTPALQYLHLHQTHSVFFLYITLVVPTTWQNSLLDSYTFVVTFISRPRQLDKHCVSLSDSYSEVMKLSMCPHPLSKTRNSSELCIHCVYKKAPTFKLSVTLSNLRRFSKLLHCWKAYKICYKTHTTMPISP